MTTIYVKKLVKMKFYNSSNKWKMVWTKLSTQILKERIIIITGRLIYIYIYIKIIINIKLCLTKDAKRNLNIFLAFVYLALFLEMERWRL